MDTKTKKLKYDARQIFTKAIREGEIVRPTNCSSCSIICVPDGHHIDYTKPLDVTWLCKSCHRLQHQGQSKLKQLPNETEQLLNSGRIKVCKSCKEIKPFNMFYVNNAALDGRHTKCIPCSIMIAKANRLSKKRPVSG